MSTSDRLLVAVLALGVAGMGIFSLVTYRRITALESKPPPARVALLPPQHGSQGTLAMADALLASGRLREAQDRYLEVLLSPGAENRSAMRGLVEIRRRLASDNAALLREQGRAYRAAAQRGAETSEHYSPAAMRFLAEASFVAADQIDGNGVSPTPQAAEGPPAPPKATARAVPRASPARPQSNLPPAQTPGTDDSFYVVLIGPFADRDQAAESAAQVTMEGYGAQLTTRTSSEPRRYVVVSEALSRRTAEARAKTLGAGGLKATIREPTRGAVRLQFGNFATQDEAEAVARRVRQKGYTAMILPEGGTVYFVLVGPHRKAMVDALTARLDQLVYTVTLARAP